MAEAPFGKYTLLRKLASGGMGEVFLAKQRGLEGFEKTLVIKRILAHHTDNVDYVDMFFAEGRLAAKMSQANIVQIYDMGQTDGSYYIAMEFVSGKSIKDIIDAAKAKNLPIAPAHVADIVGGFCAGLSYAHALTNESGIGLSIIHRDINPHNVLVSYNGDVKIIDFGIAKSDMSDHKTETGTIKGKFVYMSPEQSAAEPIDKRSDIFSAGIVLYEMLSGANPFQKANIVLSLDAIQRTDPPPPSSLQPEFAAFDAIVEKALAKKRDERYADAGDLQADLQRLVITGAIPRPPMNLAAYMHELFREQIEKEQKFIQSSMKQQAAAHATQAAIQQGRDAAQHLRQTDNGESDTGVRVVEPRPSVARPVSVVARRKKNRMPMYIVTSFVLMAATAGAAIIVGRHLHDHDGTDQGSAFNPTTVSVVKPPPVLNPVPPPVQNPVASAPVPGPVTPPPMPNPVTPPQVIAHEPTPAAKGLNPPATANENSNHGKHNREHERDHDKDRRIARGGVVVENPGPSDKGDRVVVVNPVANTEHVEKHSEVPERQVEHPDSRADFKPGGYFLLNANPQASVFRDGHPLGSATPLRIDVTSSGGTIKVGDDSSLFQLTFQYRFNNSHAMELNVDSKPRAILKKSGIGLGQTPRGWLPAGDGPQKFEFVSPEVQGSMTVVVRYFAG